MTPNPPDPFGQIGPDRFAARRELLRARLRAEGLDALLVSLDANRYYLSGFEPRDHQVDESAGCLIIRAAGPDTLCTDSRYHAAAARLWDDGDDTHIFIYGADPAARIGELLGKTLPARAVVGFESRVASVAFHEALARAAGHISLRAADGLVERLRVIKEPEEIARLEAAVAVNHALMAWLPQVVTSAGTEGELAWAIERFFRENGASGLAFPSIVAAGPNAALPHAIPGETPLGEDMCVLVDVGCRVHDYCSDQTRTFWVGAKPPAYFLTAMDQVRGAQQAAIAAIRPGVRGADVHAVAWKYFETHGVETAFTHSLGHGVGLQTHEGPRLSPRSDTVLEPGMVVTVEPGLYYPEWGGIRWEYMVLVTEGGNRIL